jgi:hypothetical protein
VAVRPIIISRSKDERRFEALSQIFSIIKGFIAAWERTISIAPKVGLKIAIVNHKDEVGFVDILNQIGKFSLIFGVVGQIPLSAQIQIYPSGFVRPAEPSHSH